MANYTNGTARNNRENNTNKQEVGIDIGQILQRIRKFWYIFLIFPMLTIALARVYLRYQVPVYEVKSTILIKDEKNKQGVSASDLISKEFGMGGNKKMLIDESKIMTSYRVIEEVVRDLKLDRIVSSRGTFISVELYGADCPILIDSFSLRDTTKDFKATLEVINDTQFELTPVGGAKQTCSFGSNFSNSFGRFLIKKSNYLKYAKEKDFNIVCKATEKAARDIIKMINIVLPKKESNILEPTMKTTMPEKAKDILQKMVTVYNDHNFRDKNEVSQNTLQFIEKRIMSLTAELTDVEQNVEEYKTKEGITADATSDINFLFSRLGEYDSELVKLGVQNSILTSIEALLRKGDATFELLPTNLDLKSSTLQTQIGDFNKLVLERNRLLKIAGENNPNLKTITEDLKRIKSAIIDNISRVKQDNGTLLARMKSKSAQFMGQLGSTPRKERELTEIKRQQNIKQGLYLFLLQKQEETGISMVGAVSDARVIDRPIIGETPVSMKKSIVYLAAVFLGLILGILYVVVQGFMVNTVQSETDITTQTSMPVLGKIPKSSTKDNLVVQAGDRSAIVEMFRLLRTNLQFFLPQDNENFKGQAILVTSSVSGEGKSFITLNLGMSLAIAEKRTVVLCLDLRRPNLFDDMALETGAAGITNYLISNLKPYDIIHASGKHKELFFIPSGPIPTNPSELMMNPKMGQLFTYLKEHFEYIVIDTSSVGLVSDALLLKPYIDMSIFVVRFAYSKKARLRVLNEFYQNQKLAKPAIVLNGVKLEDNTGYSYYGEETNKGKTASNGKAHSSLNNWIKQNFN